MFYFVAAYSVCFLSMKCTVSIIHVKLTITFALFVNAVSDGLISIYDDHTICMFL